MVMTRAGRLIFAGAVLLTLGAVPVFDLLVSTWRGINAPMPGPEMMASMPPMEMIRAVLTNVMWGNQADMLMQSPPMLMRLLSSMMAAHETMRGYTIFILLPSLLVGAILLAASRNSYPELFRRAVVGLAAGVVASVALDLVRLTGFALQWMPANLPTMFGMLILGEQASRTSMEVVGYFYHFLNGASFGLTYALVVGAGRWQWGLLWGLVIWLLMMVTPPLLMMGVGPFGVNYGPGIVVTTSVAHAVFGLVLGVSVQRALAGDRQATVWRTIAPGRV